MSILCYLWGTRNHCRFTLELWLISFPNVKMTSTVDWMTNLVMPRGEWNPSWKMSHPHKEKPVESAGDGPSHTRNTQRVQVGQLSQHTVTECSLVLGCLGSHPESASGWEGNEGKELFPPPGALPGSADELGPFTAGTCRTWFKPTSLCPLEPKAELWLLPAQTAGGTWAAWFGRGEPTALSLLRVTFLWHLCIHFWVHFTLLITLFAGSITASGLGYEHRQKNLQIS